MPALVYPSSLPAPSAAPIVSAERRLMSPQGGPSDARAAWRDRLATQQLTFPPMTADQMATFDDWWRNTLVRGGCWFASNWPLPQGMVTGVRRFSAPPTRDLIGGGRFRGYWRITVPCDVRGRSLLPRRHVLGGWVNRTMPEVAGWGYTAWSEELGLFCSVGSQAATSPDGQVWTARSMPSTGWSRIVWAKELGIFVAAAFSSNRAAWSNDGVVWHAVTLPVSGGWAGLAWSGTTLCMVDDGGGPGTRRTITSPDGINWTEHATALPVSVAWDGIVWAPELGLFVTVGSFSTASARSPDGVTWTSGGALPSSAYWREIAWSGSLFVVTNYGASSTNCLTSPDGLTWTSRTLPVSTKWGSVCWNDTKRLFCMVGNGSQSLMSPDGVTWTADPMASAADWYTVVWGHGAGAFVALAQSASAVSNSRFYD